MFGITQEKLIKSLSIIRKSLCFYIGNHCDCKYLSGDGEIGKGECSGCPEIYQAMDIIAAMTAEEFNAIRIRAKIVISEEDYFKDIQ